MRSRLVLLGTVLALASACGDSRTAPPAAPPTAVARFQPSDPSAGAMDFGDVPFPSDLYRDAAGAIRLGDLPTPLSDAPLFAAMRELFAARDGFCATCNAYFAIDGDLDREQVAALARAGEDASSPAPLPDDPIVLGDVDPASPERGRLFPLRVEWNPEGRVLAVRPVRGIALHRTRRYAVAITAGLRASDGSPLGASDAFARVRDGRADGDPALARAIAVTEPALEELAQAGVDRDAVVAVAAFTTEDVTADVLSARAAVQADPPLRVSIERVLGGSLLDDLLGEPAEDRPGIDVPPAPGSAGTRSIVHRSVELVFVGSFEAPRIVTGSGTDIGTVRRDAAGAVTAGPRDRVPFVLTVPLGVDRLSVPIAIAHHGFNASRTTGFATAETAARAGVAVLAIDAFQHGDRAVSKRDLLHAMRGDVPGPDGFAETEPLDVSGRVFGVLGAEPGLEGFTGYSMATLLQLFADVSSTVRLVRDSALEGAIIDFVRENAPGTDPVLFDSRRIGFIGNSLGAVVGAAALVAEPDLRAAVQNVQPGSIVETLAESPEFRPLVEAIFLPLLGVPAEAFDEVERHLILDPIVDLTRWALEPVDPLALAPYLERDRVVRGRAPDVLFQVASLDEVASVLATESMLAAGGFSRVTRYDPAAHGMLEVLAQVSRYEPPAAPPFRRRAMDLSVTNPIVAEHDEIRDFLERFLVPSS